MRRLIAGAMLLLGACAHREIPECTMYRWTYARGFECLYPQCEDRCT